VLRTWKASTSSPSEGTSDDLLPEDTGYLNGGCGVLGGVCGDKNSDVRIMGGVDDGCTEFLGEGFEESPLTVTGCR
jgi:hypothetical protein